MISVELWTNPVPRIPRGMSETHRNSHYAPESNYQHTWMGFVLLSGLNSNLNWPRSKWLWKVSSPTKQVMFCSGHANLISWRNMGPWFFSADKGVTIVVTCVGCWPSYAYFMRLPQARTLVQLAISSAACTSKYICVQRWAHSLTIIWNHMLVSWPCSSGFFFAVLHRTNTQ